MKPTPFLHDGATLLLSALVIAIYVLYRLLTLIRQRHLSSSGFLIVASMVTVQALLLLVDAVPLAVARLTGLNNLIWFLGYALAIFASLLYGFMACGYTPFKPGRLLLKTLWVGLLAVEGVMLFIFLAHLGPTPIWMPQTPRAALELLFALCFLGYALMVAAVGLATAITAMPMERAARLRTVFVPWR